MADDDQIELSTDRARAGSTPGVTRYVLAGGVILVVIAFLVILIV
jgi:hypothetical protein